jgi:hypothetical protein
MSSPSEDSVTKIPGMPGIKISIEPYEHICKNRSGEGDLVKCLHQWEIPHNCYPGFDSYPAEGGSFVEDTQKPDEICVHCHALKISGTFRVTETDKD